MEAKVSSGMPPEHAFLMIFGIVLLVVVITIAQHWADEGRIKDYIESRGGKFVRKQWVWGTKERVYDVVYLDSEGNERVSNCKTGDMSGVYWAENDTIGGAEPSKDAEALQAENQRLREELARLKNKKDS